MHFINEKARAICNECDHKCTAYDKSTTFVIHQSIISASCVELKAGEYAPCGKILRTDGILNKDLSALGDLSVRAFNCLTRWGGINTIGDLCDMTKEQLCRVRNLDRKTLEHIKSELAKEGLSLKDDE